MKFYIILYDVALYIAIDKGNMEIVKLLLTNKNININTNILK